MAEPPRLLQAELSRPVERLACHEPCRVQTAKGKYLLELLSRLAARARVYRAGAGQVKPALSPLAQRVGSRQQSAGCLLVVQPHVLAEEYSSGSRF
jgi:hypothetical protein